jgi:release factor glutamine methyltransferase
VESPRLQIELLLAHVLRLPRLQLYLNFERLLHETELNQVRELVRRRGNREPLQHLTGATSFCGLDFAVGPEVLIPRPETEVLAERAWNLLAASSEVQATALDFGTGSGCLAITLACHCPAARITALEVSEPALAVARANAARHGVADRINWVLGDGFEAVHPGAQFDIVVANPPYIPTDEIAGLTPEVRDYEPRRALDGGSDGLGLIRRLATQARAFMRPTGYLVVEFGDGQAEAIAALFAASGWAVDGVEPDLSGRARIFVARPGAK